MKLVSANTLLTLSNVQIFEHTHNESPIKHAIINIVKTCFMEDVNVVYETYIEIKVAVNVFPVTFKLPPGGTN